MRQLPRKFRKLNTNTRLQISPCDYRRHWKFCIAHWQQGYWPIVLLSGEFNSTRPKWDIQRLHPLISGILGPSGCSTYGPLGFVQGSSTNKCSLVDTFQIQSNTEDTKLGSKLVFNFVGEFYACGGSHVSSCVVWRVVRLLTYFNFLIGMV